MNNLKKDDDISKGHILLDFAAKWCGPCKQYEPTLVAVEPDFPEVKFYKVDIDELTAFASINGVRGVPTTLMMLDGKIIDRHVGQMTATAVKAFIRSNL